MSKGQTLLWSAQMRHTQRESCGGIIERLANLACALDEELRRHPPDLMRLRRLLDAPRDRATERRLAKL